MELEVGMYVRTKDGKIDKIFQYNENPDNPLFETINCYSVMKGKYKKATHNIIDLIEVGDYVNGYYVEDIGKTFINVSTGSNYFQNPTIYEDDIKSIVTKEQFESMSYQVVE